MATDHLYSHPSLPFPASLLINSELSYTSFTDTSNIAPRPSMNGQAQTKRAEVSLQFIVVGGSIAGLGTAYALRRAGHVVVVLERSDGKIRSQGGIRCCPNMTKILREWDLGPALSKISESFTLINMENGCNGDHLGCIEITESFLDDLLQDLVFPRHGDLQSLLYKAAVDAGVRFQFNTEVADVDRDATSVTLKGGKVLQADVVVVAEGPDSLVRELAVDDGECVAGDERDLVCCFQVPADALRLDEELRKMAVPLSWTIWFGDEFTVNANYLGNTADLFNVAIVRKSFNRRLKDEEEWKPRTVEELQLQDLNFEPRLSKLLNLAQNLSGRVHRARPPLESLVSEHGNFVLVGEAAHPMPPLSHHSTSLALEDAQTLGLLFSRITRKDQIPRMLSAYEEIRFPRIDVAWNYERHTQMMLLPNGSELMTMRDSIMRSALAHEDPGALDEETFKMVWGNELSLVAHNATEKVEDWWNQWGGAFRQCDEKGERRTSISVMSMMSRGDGHPNET